MSKVKLISKTCYGSKYFYPDCQLSRLLANTRHSKTLSLENIRAILAIGYEVEYTGQKTDLLDEMGAKFVG